METHTMTSSSEESLSIVMMNILGTCFPGASIIKPPHRTNSHNNSEHETPSQPTNGNDNDNHDMDTPETPFGKDYPVEQEEDSKN